MQALALPFSPTSSSSRPSFDPPAAETALERMKDLGHEALSTIELLTIVIGGGEAKGRKLALDALGKVGSLKDLSRIGIELLHAKGLTSKRAARIVAALELGRRAMMPDVKRARIEGPEQAAALLLPQYQHRDREHFGILILDARNGVIGRRTVAVGSLNASLVHPREVFAPAMTSNPRGARIMLWHNHPSGDPTPSPEDVALTRRLVEIGRLMGIEVVDHIVLGDGRYESLREGHSGAISFA